MSNIDFTNLYSSIYSRPLSEVKFEGYIYQNLEITKNNVAYINEEKCAQCGTCVEKCPTKAINELV